MMLKFGLATLLIGREIGVTYPVQHNGPQGPRRSEADLMQELLFHGNVAVEARRPYTRALSIALMCFAPFFLIGGLVSTVAFFFVEGGPVLPVALFTTLVGAAMLSIGLIFRRHSYQTPGAVWTIDARGVTVDGVGPVPWWDLLPPVRRLEPGPAGQAHRPAWAMPLTAAGAQRALTLAPWARDRLHQGSRGAFNTPRPLESVWIPHMKEMSAKKFAGFLTEAHRHFTRGGQQA